MSFLDGLRHRLRILRRPAAYDRELDEEFRFHLALETMQQAHAAREAESPHIARSRARRRFGNATYHKEETRRMSALGFFDTARQDVRFALRTLRRTPAFTVGAVLTLALGIGANTAIFSAVDAMLLRPLPFSKPDQLMLVSITLPPRHGESARDDAPWSYLKAKLFRESQHVFTDVALASDETVTLQLGDPTREHAEVVDEHYLPTLGIQPVVGRNFEAPENAPNARHVVLVSQRFWNGRLNADPRVLGRTLDIEHEPYTIIGVLPHGFTGISGHADLWMTIGARRPYYFEPNEAWDHEFTMIGRLASGVTPARARADTRLLGPRVNAAFPAFGGDAVGWGATARPLDGVRVDPIVRRSLLVLLGAVAFVLLIACANLANLFLVRASARQREIAVRLAIGASRRRLVRQLLTESVLLSVVGGIASVALAWWGTRLLATISPERALGARQLSGLGVVNFTTIHLDWRTLAFAAAAALATGVLFGLVPALHSTRPSLAAALKDGAPDSPHGGQRRHITTRDLLVIVQLALALVLLAGAGVMMRSLGKLLGVDPGFDASHVFTLRLDASSNDGGADSLPGFYHQLLARLGALPSVQSVALGNCAPLTSHCNSTVVWLGGRAATITGAEPGIGIILVTPDWFKTLRVPLLAGRTLTDADRQGSLKVLVVNETAARRLWPNGSAIGKRIGIGMGGFDTATVVGVVGDVRFDAIDSLPGMDAYASLYQSSRPGTMAFLRTIGDPSSLATSSRRVVQDLASDVPVYDARTLASRVADATSRERFSAFLLGLFATAALVLAGIGIYGVVSYTVARRTREIGVRIALGATRGDVLRLIVGRGAALASVALVVGLGAAVMATRVLRTLLFDVAPTDPGTYLLVVALLVGAALVASWIPARRAATANPADALRD